MSDKRKSMDFSTFPDLQIGKSIGTPKASPTTSTSTRFYSVIEENRRKKKQAIKLHPVTDSEEFKLLCKLYLPKRYQSLTDKSVLSKQLANNLPILLPSNGATSISYPKLNLELHLFLANIVAGYVASWFGKLNTDNIEFIQNVYLVLCDFIKSLSTRFSLILSRDNILGCIDDISGILNNHFQELVGENKLKILEQPPNPGKIVDRLTDDELIEEYLKTRHIIFETSEKQAYFRILVKKLLVATFNEENEQYGPLNTKIGVNFIDIIVADLVLDKIMDKLSDPQFILSLILRITLKAKEQLDGRLNIKQEAGTRKPIRDRIKSMFSKSYKDLSYLVIWNDDGTDTDLNILNNQLFVLLDNLTGFSIRKPMLTGILCTVKNAILSNNIILSKINRILKKALFKSSMGIVNDETLANIICSLRYSIFKPVKGYETESAPITVEELSVVIYELLHHKSVEQFLKFMNYQQESEDDIIKSIQSTLLVFESKSLNQWLVIKLVDNLIANLYPEIFV